ncbi:MAG: DUF4115 domain-containing protein [Candidatus Omnitrophica bacterium]|nr:DUF4115 domain-containing protein [Candidatus Omnitrophota bacterium]MBD3269270.1 DUF4115 domain-containing protein [Candidatus Omnitrophota bacterium]
MIKELCRKLKEKRKEMGYTLEEVVERTKLHPSVVRDIESGNIHNISPVYLKGFIRIYASFLNVDTGSALEEITPPSKIPRRREPKTKKKDYTRIAAKFLERLTGLVSNIPLKVKKGAILVVLALLAAWLLFSGLRCAVKKTAKFFNRAKPQKVEAPAETQAPMPQIDTSKEIVVSLTVKDKLFARVKVDGDILFEGILNRGAVESWKADKEIELKLSDGSAVYLEVNGKPVPTLTSMHKPIKSLKITPSGISVDK